MENKSTKYSRKFCSKMYNNAPLQQQHKQKDRDRKKKKQRASKRKEDADDYRKRKRERKSNKRREKKKKSAEIEVKVEIKVEVDEEKEIVFHPIMNKGKVDYHQPQFTDSEDDTFVMESTTKGVFVELFPGISKP